MIGCECAVCRSTDPRDRRTRPSIYIELHADEVESTSGPYRANTGRVTSAILVDTSTDLREQALAHAVTRVDAILFTHSHADHIMGLDEVRRFNVLQRAPIPCFGDVATLDDLRRTFAYAFDSSPVRGGGIPQITLFRIAGPFCVGDVEIVPVPLLHGARSILGFRLGPFAYLTDCSGIPTASWPLLAGVEILVLDALRDRPHPTHFSVPEAIAVAERVGPSRTLFTHICHDLPHEATCRRLPTGVELAYDGQVIDVQL